jgi:tRNA (guanine37-N1)-methyltransferase|tara:strand:- start:189 stop:881 length:693 start_codon:yes stop_codon:yes gene_type:complete
MIRVMYEPLRFDVLSLFPETLNGFTSESIIGRACEHGLIDVQSLDLRNWAEGRHRVTDDRPFGGGAGMVLKPEPIFAAVEELRSPDSKVLYMAPDGESLCREVCQELSEESHLIVLSGHYEGVDQRVRDELVDREISVGDFVLTNGALAAATLIDSVSRFVPGVLGEAGSLSQDSFTGGRLSFPQYTRPADFRGMKVPEVLLSGDHGAIARWREERMAEKTRVRRPDLLN